MSTLTYKGGGVLQIMNTTDLNALSQAVLEYMAINDGPGSIYTANASGNVLIGTFTDTNFTGNIGEGNITLITNTYSLYQDFSIPTGTEPPRPIRYSSNTSPLQSSTNNQIDSLANTILQYCLTEEGPFAYRIANASPSGGTWQNMGTLSDVYTPGTTNSYYLWKKLSSGSFTLYRPLKSAGAGVLQSFTNTEINQLSKKVRERIVNTGIGSYLLQSATPTPGTWTNVGTLTDTRPTTSSFNYDGSTEVAYNVDELYTGTVPADYTGPGNAPYTGPSETAWVGTTPANFTGFVPANFAGIRYYYFASFVPTQFTGEYSFAGSTPATYEGTVPAQFAGSQPDGGTYTDLQVPPYTGSVGYLGVTPTQFTGVTPAVYTMEGTSFAEFFVYSGPGGFAEYQAGPPLAFYNGPTGSDVWAWTGYGPNYAGPAFTPVRAAYVPSYNPEYFVGTVPAQFAGVTPTYFSGEVTYEGLILNNYSGPAPAQFAGVTPSNFFGFAPANYLGPRQFTGGVLTYFQGGYLEYFAGSTPVQYTGVTPAAYTGPSETVYTGTADNTAYGGLSPVVYTLNTDYTGTVGAVYTGSIINNDTSTITTLTLWRRIA